jgi:predicted DNA binding protein
MWILKLKIKHDCTIGSRCEKFKVVSYSIPLGNWKGKGISYTSERHTLEGDEKNIKRFINDLKKDKRIKNIEIDKNTLFFISYNKKEKIPSSFYNQKMFFTQPVFVDKEGFEYWEVGSYDRKILEKFLDNFEKQKGIQVELLSFKSTKLNNVYFPAVMPELTEKQKRAFELAVENGYYTLPKRTDLKKLAKLAGIALATYAEHLKRAESKVIQKLTI